MRLKIFASSSSGNCALVETGGKRILIDAGLSFRKICAALEGEEISPQEIDAVFVTHEHGDHVIGLGGFSALGVPIYATRGTAGGIIRQEIKWTIVPSAGKFAAAQLRVETFTIPHDAGEPVGYAIDDGEERLVWALDVGHLDKKIKTVLKSATILVLESNYCPDMLEKSGRPFHLKQRIRGRHGHLSNDETFEFLTAERSESWKQIYLAHVSRQCNNVEKLEALYASSGLPIEVVDPWGEPIVA
jgi:phosphoribosyl 1,2-cyclic phosphodiesterase